MERRYRIDEQIKDLLLAMTKEERLRFMIRYAHITQSVRVVKKAKDGSKIAVRKPRLPPRCQS